MKNIEKVSIITVCRNAEKHIESAIQSALSQTYPNIEYIIIDGASTDGTMAIVNKYRDRISKIISEKDAGIYEAMNKGIKFAAGDILYFLNSDDRFCDQNVIRTLAAEFQNDQSLGIVYGEAEFTNIPERVSKTFQQGDFEYKNRLDLILKRVIPQQCVFATRAAYDKVGSFNTSYQICADYDWFLRAFNHDIKNRFIRRKIAIVNAQGLSYTKRYEVIHEKIKTVYRNVPFNDFLIYFIVAFLRKLKHIFLEECVPRIRRK